MPSKRPFVNFFSKYFTTNILPNDFDIQFVNGKLEEQKIIAQFSSIAGSDIGKLKDMYSTLQMCSNMTSKLLAYSHPKYKQSEWFLHKFMKFLSYFE
jgi:hypothetical protein